MASTYVAPITLGFTPADGDLIGGTVNGVEVSGKWMNVKGGVQLHKGAAIICAVCILDVQAVVVVQQESAPTTDYELHLYRYTPAGIVQIPQEYVEGLEATAADATAAKTAAETAQTAAETAQSTANAAKTAAEAAIGADVIKGNYILRMGQPKYAGYGFAILHKDSSGNEHEKAIFYNNGLYFYRTGGGGTRLDATALNIGGDLNANTCIIAEPNIDGSSQGYIMIKHNGVSTSLRNDGVIECPNHVLTIGYSGYESGIILGALPNKQIKLTVSDDARPTFTDTSDPNNTWTPGENLPTVTASDSGKFLRVSANGAWEAETTAIPTQVQSDYDENSSTSKAYIKNRPCYSEPLLKHTVSVDDSELALYKVSDEIPSFTPALQDTVYLQFNGKTRYEVSCLYSTSQGYVLTELSCVVALIDNATFNVDGVQFSVPERGTYYLYVENGNQVLWPSGIANSVDGAFEVPWNGKFYKVKKKLEADYIPWGEGDYSSLHETISSIATDVVDAKKALFKADEIAALDGDLISVELMYNKPYDQVRIVRAYKHTSTTGNIESVVSDSALLENKKGIIVDSSTAGSTKKFKITVDDTGTISATEVTT